MDSPLVIHIRGNSLPSSEHPRNPGWVRVRAIANAIADLSLGRACAGCDAPGSSLCAVCQELFCAPPHIIDALALDDVLEGLRISVWANTVYETYVRAGLVRFKDHGHRSLAPLLGQSLALSITCALEDAGLGSQDVAIVPVPSRADATRRRGFDPVDTIARSCLRAMSRSMTVIPALIDGRTHGSAKRLGASDRSQIAAGAFHVRRTTSLPVIVVDDIFTTGATLTEASSTLMHSGMHVVAAACVAQTPRT